LEGKTPDEIREFVRNESAIGRFDYEALFAAAAAALGPSSPEAAHAARYSEFVTKYQDRADSVETSMHRTNGYSGEYFISSRGWVDCKLSFIRWPSEHGTVPEKPTMAEFLAAHEAAAAEFERRDAEERSAKAATALAANAAPVEPTMSPDLS
jgi:hypothetical protein